MNNYHHQYYYHSCYYKKPRNGLSLLPLVLCLFVFCYGFVVHALDVSLCDAMRDVRFLFFFSNVIILFVVADYGAFVSSSEGEESVEESYGTVAADDPAPYSVVIKIGSYVEDAEVERELSEGEGNVLVQARSGEVDLLAYNGAGTVDGGEDGDEDGEGLRVADEEGRVAEEGEQNHEPPGMLDETDKDEDGDVSTAADEEERVDVREEEDDKFSQMSDEELNKRVEEFIWRLKTQIRLQAARDAE